MSDDDFPGADEAPAPPPPAPVSPPAVTPAAAPPPAGLRGPQVPAQNIEAEESVLGAMLISPGAVGAVTEVLGDGDAFYRESHAIIYRAMQALVDRGEPADAITVCNELEKIPTEGRARGNNMLEAIGGRGRVHELAALVPASANAAHYARIVREMSTLRGIIRAGAEITRLGLDRPGETAELVERTEQIVFDLSMGRTGNDVARARDLIGPAYDRLRELAESGRDIIGVPTGLKTIDDLTSGFQPGNLIVLAARPSMGKSALALCIAAHVTMHVEIPAVLFTLEMSRNEVMQRLMCVEGMVDSQKVRNGRHLDSDDWQRLNAASSKIERSQLFVDDSSLLTVGEIRAKARRLKMRNPDLALIIVDYLQLMASGGQAENRVQEVSQISRSLKVLAGELEVPVLALSQLSRAVEQRHDKRPILSDLRESGSIEQDADLVMFLYRDEYYNPEDTDQHGLAEVNVAKQRNGPTATAKLAFVKKYTRFGDPTPPGLSG